MPWAAPVSSEPSTTAESASEKRSRMTSLLAASIGMRSRTPRTMRSPSRKKKKSAKAVKKKLTTKRRTLAAAAGAWATRNPLTV